jgi:hypothetical protein
MFEKNKIQKYKIQIQICKCLKRKKNCNVKLYMLINVSLVLWISERLERLEISSDLLMLVYLEEAILFQQC